MHRTKQSWRPLLVCLLLATATLTVLWPVVHHEFINYDDPDYVTINPHLAGGLTWENLKWAITNTYANNWHPLTWISHMLDVQLFGFNPGWHHLTNLLFHTANSLLLLLLLKRLTGAFWRSASVAALFALHPLHVESVAWLAERKDVLSAFFFMLTLWAYAGYVSSVECWVSREREESKVHRPESREQPTKGNLQPATCNLQSATRPSLWYTLALVFFALGLMSKPMLVTLPFVLLLLDYWPLQRFQLATCNLQPATPKFQPLAFSLQPSPSSPPSSILHPLSALGRLALEKWPFFALTLASSVVTFLAQKSGGAMESLQHLPFKSRLSHSVMGYFTYLQKLAWPSDLAVLYPRPDRWPLEQIGLAVLLLVGITTAVLLLGRKYPYLAVGWLWYGGMLVPVIGLVQVGSQFIADRYTYLPYIGLFIALVWAGWALARAYGLGYRVLFPAAFLVLASSSAVTQRQVRFWLNSETLFLHCLAVTENNYVAHNNLATFYRAQGRREEAKRQLRETLLILPQDVQALHNLGVMLAQEGDYQTAAPCLRSAVQLKPELADVYVKLALELEAQGRTDQAIACYRDGARLEPPQPPACNNLAWILATHPEARFRDGNEAVRLAEQACEATGYQQTPLVGTLAAAYAEANRFDRAVATAEKAVALAAAAGQTELAERNRQLLDCYRSGKPWRETAAGPDPKP